MSENTQIEDKDLAESMAYAEKPIRDEALKAANDASDKVRKSFEQMKQVAEGFEGQTKVLFDRVLQNKNLPSEVVELFKSPVKTDAKTNGGYYYKLVGDKPYPNDETLNKQFSAKTMRDILSGLDGFTSKVNYLPDIDGQDFHVNSHSADYLSIRSKDLPNLAISVGIINPNNLSTVTMLSTQENREPTLDEIFARNGSKVFSLDVIAVPARQ